MSTTPADGDSEDEAKQEVDLSLAMYSFDPQPEGVIRPHHTLAWQTVRANGNSAEWFHIAHDDAKGRMICASREFASDVVLLEYFGQEVLDKDAYAAYLRKTRYAPCETEYCFEMKWGLDCVAIQAMKEDGTFGRLVNHTSTERANCRPQRLKGSFPRLVLVSSREIKVGDELLYSYGDRMADEQLQEWFVFV